MTAFQKIYEVISANAVMVEHAGGNPSVHPPKDRFASHPNNKSVVRLLRINAIREVSTREIPNFDTSKPPASNADQS